MCSKVKVFICFLLFDIISAEILQIADGKLEGTVMETRWSESFHAFLKIPFAEPPIGDLRFKEPVKKQPWDGVLNCTVFGPVCMQRDDWGLPMSEDCLHLNIFTKSLSSNILKPVIVFIHGGGFESGSSIEHVPDYLMERDVVLVTINYRLGAFGFLALEIEEATGNQGLKDQSMALRWIQRNIRYFGGDPTRVTVAGLSALPNASPYSST